MGITISAWAYLLFFWHTHAMQGYVPTTNWVLADVTPRIRVVIPEPVIVQSCLCIPVLPLVLEWNERGWPFPLPPVDVQLLLPNLVALFVVGLQGRTEVVGDDGETLAVGNKLGGRHERVLLEEPSDHLIFFRPFVQWHVAVPNEVRGGSCKGFSDAAAEGVVGERHLLAVGTHDVLSALHLLYHASSGIALKGHFYLGVLGTQQQAVVGETAGAC